MKNNNQTINIEIDITRECNYNCPSCNRFCNIHNKNPKSIMTTDEVKNILLELNKYNVQKLSIIGGEPTLHPNFFEICRIFQKYSKCKNIVLNTNYHNNSIIDTVRNIYKFTIQSETKNLNYSEAIKQKIQYHINGYNITNLSQSDCNYQDCSILNQCGICIYKFNNQIRYAICACAVFVSRLLQKEEKYTFTSLSQLLNNYNTCFKDICTKCAFYTNDNKFKRKNIKSVDFSIISSEFSEGLNYIKTHEEDYL